MKLHDYASVLQWLTCVKPVTQDVTMCIPVDIASG